MGEQTSVSVYCNLGCPELANLIKQVLPVKTSPITHYKKIMDYININEEIIKDFKN